MITIAARLDCVAEHFSWITRLPQVQVFFSVGPPPAQEEVMGEGIGEQEMEEKCYHKYRRQYDAGDFFSVGSPPALHDNSLSLDTS